MKKPFAIIRGLVLVGGAGLGLTVVAPFLMGAEFEVVNESRHVVRVSAYWRDQSKEIGPVPPSSSVKFNVNDEAAMEFSGRFPDGREAVTEQIYFTGGVGVIATVTETGFEVKYDHEP